MSKTIRPAFRARPAARPFPSSGAVPKNVASDNKPIPPPTGPKVTPEQGRILQMLREKFGRAVRAVRVMVETEGDDVRLQLRGEVPSEAIRDAVIREVTARVERVRVQDFELIVSGPVPLIEIVEADIDGDFGAMFSRDLHVGVTMENSNRSTNGPTPVLWDLWTGHPINELNMAGLESTLHAVLAFAPDGKTLATGLAHSEIVLWELPQGHKRTFLEKARDILTSNDVGAVAFAPNCKMLASVRADKGEVWLWNLEGGHQGRLLGSQLPNLQYFLAFSPDGTLLVSAADRAESIILWDLATRNRKSTLQTGQIHIEALAWSPDSKSIAVGRTIEEQGVLLLDAAGGVIRKFAPSRGKTGLIHDIAFSPDGKTLATRHESVGVILWDVASGKEWTRLESQKVGNGRGIGFSPDGDVLGVACNQMEPWTTGPPGFQFWDVSERPGAAPATGDFPPHGAKPIPPRHDSLEEAVQAMIMDSEGPDRAKNI